MERGRGRGLGQRQSLGRRLPFNGEEETGGGHVRDGEEGEGEMIRREGR